MKLITSKSETTVRSDRILHTDAVYKLSNTMIITNTNDPKSQPLFFSLPRCMGPYHPCCVTPKLLSRFDLWLLDFRTLPSRRILAGHCSCHRWINNPRVSVTYLSTSSHLMCGAFFSSVFVFLIWAFS